MNITKAKVIMKKMSIIINDMYDGKTETITFTYSIKEAYDCYDAIKKSNDYFKKNGGRKCYFTKGVIPLARIPEIFEYLKRNKE
jgi:hypothetical protein